MTWTRASLGGGVGTLLLALLPACGEGDAPAAPPVAAAPSAPAAPTGLVRLWRPPPGLAPVVFPGDDEGGSTQQLWRTVFDGTDGHAWRMLQVAPSGEEGLRYRPVELASGPVVLQRKEGWAAVTSVPVAGGQAVTVRVTAHAQGQKGVPVDVPVAAVVERREPLDTAAQLTSQDMRDMLDPRRTASHVLEGKVSADTQTLADSFVTDRSTTELAVHLLAPTGGSPHALVVESVEVATVPLARLVRRGGEFPRLTRIPDPVLPVARLTLDRDDREGLLAWPGERLVFTLPACEVAQRLALSLGVAPRDPVIAGAVTLSARLELPGEASRVLIERRRTAPADAAEPAWQDEQVELPPLPSGGRLALACAGEGADPPLAFFAHPTLSRPAPGRRPNVLLISLDTLRPDKVGCYGGTGGNTPHLDALAAQGLRFAHAYSTSSYTLPSHGSLLTGQWPALHGAVNITDHLDPARSPFLAQLLADGGWITAAFTGGGYVSPDFGFAHGFDRYADNDPVWALDSLRGQTLLHTMSWERTPQQVALLQRYAAPAIAEWIERAAGGPPFFLFLHTYIVHNWAPDLAALRRHGLLGPDGEQAPFNHQDRKAFNEGRESGEAAREKITAAYLPYYVATIDMADDFVGHVLEALDQAGLADDTLVLLTSDHGEEFGEHGFFGHGETLYEEAVRVPLIARLPRGAEGAPAGSVAEPLVSLADVAPWILRLCGLPPDPRMFAGAPLGPDSSSPPGRRRLYIELDTQQARLSAVRMGDLKLHALLEGRTFGLQAGEQKLFDIAADPGEATDLCPTRASDCAALRARLDEFHAFTEAMHPRGAGGPPDRDLLSPEQRRMLEGLGYLQGGR
ncbi:MAG TPA: sulfatase [Planctomycetota bacterium]|nr:sulfatase [Planctomycetota bacterium]